MSELEDTQKALMNAMDRVTELSQENARLEFDNATLERNAAYYKELKKPEHEMVVPERIAKTILRSLVWDKANKRDEINEAFGWIDQRSRYEEMGG
jgi:hypothetical protein